ncbi:TPA: CRISPR-associated helicase Cas3' [Aeromonas veronii]|nr:CRISPR-associated helicase Cas3' [Aeromonas veronii]
MPTKSTDIAHVRINDDGTWAEPHLLDEHLIHVAKMAASFAHSFGAGWAELAGRWHDLGKYSENWQSYLRSKSGYEAENAHMEQQFGRVPHSMGGAIHAIEKLGPGVGHLLAYLIAGHHAGLPDWYEGASALSARLVSGRTEYTEALAASIPDEILGSHDAVLNMPRLNPSSVSIWLRMLFSCLVDADFLDTERYMSPAQYAQRGHYPAVTELQQRYQDFMVTLQMNASASPLQSLRNVILQQALAAAELAPGMFSLTVPTGGGKTLASLGFALAHALRHGKKRIIYAIPFTSIIEQNAAVFRRVLGDDAVLEHHSDLDGQEEAHARLATENWDAPIIVTTNVQLFESLHASRTSRCRKLHNLADSIIILDEAQQLPRDFHEPITRSMQQLTDFFGVSWVLCTATQPVLAESRDLFGRLLLGGLRDVREMMSEPEHLARQLKRVDIQIATEPTSWEQIANKVIAEEVVLCIVNTRRHARELYTCLPDDGNNLHLSAHMCAEHRSAVIGEIRNRLAARQAGGRRPLRVVSTQLIEAGVDLDFPVVFRAMAGLDAIAQAAGRCNREGRLSEPGKVWVFMPQQSAPVGLLRQAEQCTLELVKAELLSDPLAPESFVRFFELLNAKGERDKYGICRLLKAERSSSAPVAIQFRTAAEKFRLIDNRGVPLIVPYRSPGAEESPTFMWLSKMALEPGATWIYRRLQRYTVTVPESLAIKLQQLGAIELESGMMVLLESHYNSVWGVEMPDVLLSAEASVI